MKSVGVVRKLDQLGRIVLPMETRRTFKIDTGDPVEVYVDGENIVLRKYEPGCIFCGEANHTVGYEGKNICKGCIEKIKSSM